MKKIILFVVLLSITAGVLFWKYSGGIFNKSETEPKIITLNFWELSENEQVLRKVVEVFQSIHPNVKVVINKQTVLNYRTRLQTQLQAGQGPDIFEIHSSWLPLFSGYLSAAPDSIININDYSQIFYPLAKETLTNQGKIYALPLETDGVAMYYNEDILTAAGMKVPATWQEFVDSAQKMTVKNQLGQIQTSGAGLGATENIDFWPEIIGLLFLQQAGGNFSNPATKDGVEILQFYTSFVIDPKNKTWDVNLPPSTKMFIDGKLAFYFAPYSQARILQAANPALHFKVAPTPQLPNKNLNYGSFWAGAVSSKSPYQRESWEFLNFLDSAEALKIIAQEHLQAQTLGKLPPRIDMATLLSTDPIAGAFIAQAPNYKSWYLNSATSDSGINEEMISLYRNAINSVLQGQDTRVTLQNAATEIKQVLAKYQIEN